MSSEPIKIVFFYAEVVGYVVGMLKALTRCGRPTDIDVVFRDKKHINSSRYFIGETEDIRFHPRSSMDDKELLELLSKHKPDIIVVSGWVDKGYLRALRRHRSAGGVGKIVCGIDDQWRGTLRQYIGKIYFRLFYYRLFDFMWVSGKPQYHYAQRFGYDHECIISNLYSSDNEIFNEVSRFSKRFVFIGRFDPVKALDMLADAYLSLPDKIKEEWPLVLIGDGELKENIERRKSNNIIVKPFMQPEELVQELLQGGVACIPSHKEAWGVAIHDMALLGFPMVLSSDCGAATEFLITGYNGYLFRRGDTNSLRKALHRIAILSDEELELYSQRSNVLGKRITSEHVAHSLLSTIQLSEI